MINPPKRKEKITLRLMILLGFLSIANFFYWFFQPTLIEDYLLFALLLGPLIYDSMRLLYMWYHYWDISVPVKPKLGKPISADVLTTYFPGEPYEMIKETLLAIQKIKYPHTTYLCDEANDQYLKDFCRKNGIIHITRNNRIDAKAGNINNALSQANGDVCLILDPDHIPAENFLDEVIPYFEDDTIGFVQTVQAYYNLEQSLVARGAAEQTFHFYGPVMMSMNSYGTVNAIGANCVFRRKALDSIGGHAAGLAEDMHTAMQLHAKGWKSIYLPQIFTKGLVPASITAYYKQQLKWSRGTMELLVSVYPKLFKKFTWRQKIHYGLLPLHYLSGLIYLISFLIPIISLFSASTPWNGNVIDFGYIFLPIISSIICIRFYVQRWVMNERERGLHLVGGLLMTCSWWVFLIGCIYTITRKKVPYLPTPKEDNELTSWIVLIPNLFIALLSFAAVIYGLSIDFTPFSIFMSGFALLNAFFMLYTLVFAFQKQKRAHPEKQGILRQRMSLNAFKDYSFQLLNKVALPIVITIFIGCGYQFHYNNGTDQSSTLTKIHQKPALNYIGIFSPLQDNGISSLEEIAKTTNEIDEHFDIISIYLAWDKNENLDPINPLLDSIYKQKSIPMITWEPWLNSFDSDHYDDKHVFELIGEGYFDEFIKNFSIGLKELNRPVFLRFAHEFDNPFYPWYSDAPDAAKQFKRAWIHISEIFKQQEALNVIWIWNPWKPENVTSFYPGKEYVDWLGVNILNYGQWNKDGKSHSFKDLYEPFHNEFNKIHKTPVIISEFGSLNNIDHTQPEWFNNALTDIQNNFNEIKSIVYFNSKVDNNWPNGVQKNDYLDWNIVDRQIIKKSFSIKESPDYAIAPPYTKALKNEGSFSPKKSLKGVRGVNLKKGQEWKKDYHVLNRKNLEWDFAQLNSLGINTIKFQENDIYDYNVLQISKEYNLNISYGFWIPGDIDFVNDSIESEKLTQHILNKIRKQKQHKNIISWHVQNDVLSDQKKYYNKPELFFQNHAYVIWLQNLITAINAIDAKRPIIIDLEINRNSVSNAKLLINNVLRLDALGLVIKNDHDTAALIAYLKETNTKHIYSEIDVYDIKEDLFNSSETPFFISTWQDQHQSNTLNFDGIVDRKNRLKPAYFRLRNILGDSAIRVNTPAIGILKPAKLVYEKNNLLFRAMVYDSLGGWTNAKNIKGLKFEWALVKCDPYGNFLSLKEIGNQAEITIKIPKDHESYRLHLTTSRGDTIATRLTRLHIPLNRNETQDYNKK